MVTRLPHPTHTSATGINRKGAILAAGLAAALATVSAVRHDLITVRRAIVVGDSMVPAFRPGDRVIVVGPWPVRPGQAVAVTDPRQPDRLMVKRVRAAGGRWVDVRGDNPERSTDSRQFGPVGRDRIVGRVVYRYWPSDRSGWIP